MGTRTCASAALVESEIAQTKVEAAITRVLKVIFISVSSLQIPPLHSATAKQPHVDVDQRCQLIAQRLDANRFHQYDKEGYAGGRSVLLIQPSTLSDFSGSGRSHVRHCMIAGPLPFSGGARIIFRPHLGQLKSPVAKECPSFGTNCTTMP